LFVDGELPDDFRQKFVKMIRGRTMKPLDPDEEALERSGWCAIGDPFGLDLGYEDVFYNEFINLGYRTDRWKLPGALLRTKIKEAETAYLTKKGRERLSRTEKKELKELVSRKLRKQIPPAMKVIDLSWSLDQGLVRFFSHSDKPIGLMCELFHRTFALKLIPEAPYTLAARLGLTPAQQTRWDDLETTSFLRAGEGASR
jgi:hypothetical protein